ncbi:MAG: MATE family efflux transporter [Erysipelotrichaceae bacterium]
MKKDLTVGKPISVLISFALPMLVASIFQQIYNVADSVVVGQFVSSEALAAVGSSFSIMFLIISIGIGFGNGCSVVISQFLGAREDQKAITAIWTTLITFLILGLIVSVVGQFYIPVMLDLMQMPISLTTYASDYLTYIFLGAVFVFLYNANNAIFISLGDSKSSMIFLIIASLINIVLDLYFVIVLNWGVSGVAIATLIAQGFSAFLSFVVLYSRIKSHYQISVPIFDFKILRTMFRVGIPSLIQQSVISFSILLVQGLINSFQDVNLIAGITSGQKIDSMAMMPMFSLSNALSTYTAQNIGAKKFDRIIEGYYKVLMLAVAIGCFISLIIFIFGNFLIGMFVNSEAPIAVYNYGVEYLRVVSVFYFLMSCMVMTTSVLRGSGDMFSSTIGTLSNLGVRVIAAYLLSSIFGYVGIFYSIPLGWLIGSLFSIIMFKRGNWRKKAVV